MSKEKKDVVNELHAPARRNYRRRRVILKGLRDLLQADLVEMIPYAKENKGYKYILMVINAFSKFGWALPLKSKTGKEVATAMKSIFDSGTKNIPKNLQTDQGKEFYNKEFQDVMKKYNVNHYSTYSNLKSSIVERFNRTIKEKMWKEFSMKGNYKWIDMIYDLINKYNNTVHRTTNVKPKSVNQQNAKLLMKSVFNHVKTIDLKNPKFRVGDYVRISKHRQAFAKGYTPNWSNEVFTVASVQTTNPRTYLIRDTSGENILGGFYAEELQKTKHPDVYLVEKVLKRRGNKVLVKWLGMSPAHNSWISKNNVL